MRNRGVTVKRGLVVDRSGNACASRGGFGAAASTGRAAAQRSDSADGRRALEGREARRGGGQSADAVDRPDDDGHHRSGTCSRIRPRGLRHLLRRGGAHDVCERRVVDDDGAARYRSGGVARVTPSRPRVAPGGTEAAGSTTGPPDGLPAGGADTAVPRSRGAAVPAVNTVVAANTTRPRCPR